MSRPRHRRSRHLSAGSKYVHRNFLQFPRTVFEFPAMTKPLALIFYERLMPGSQLVNRLQDLGYRVSTCTDLTCLHTQVEQELPMVIVMDLHSKRGDLNSAIKALRKNEKTSHIPIVAFTGKTNKLGQNA